jgi:hypothetical protein
MNKNHKKILHVIFSYQFTKNMKYLGPKGSIQIKHQNSKKPIIQHHINGTRKLFKNETLSTNIVVGFEADKVLKTFDSQPNYMFVLDHKYTNHGKILKDILLKYNKTEEQFAGCLISSEISFIPKTTLIDMDLNESYCFCTEQDITTDITCNINDQDSKIEYISYNTSPYKWTGMAYLSNEAIRLVKHINLAYNTDPLFLMEVLNQSISSGLKINMINLKKKDFVYIKNNSLKHKQGK